MVRVGRTREDILGELSVTNIENISLSDIFGKFQKVPAGDIEQLELLIRIVKAKLWSLRSNSMPTPELVTSESNATTGTDISVTATGNGWLVYAVISFNDTQASDTRIIAQKADTTYYADWEQLHDRTPKDMPTDDAARPRMPIFIEANGTLTGIPLTHTASDDKYIRYSYLQL